MKKLILLLSLGLFAAGAFATEIPPAKPPVSETVSRSDYQMIVAERDQLRQQLAESQSVATVYKAQRNDLASTVLDLNVTVSALQNEVKRLSAPPAAK